MHVQRKRPRVADRRSGFRFEADFHRRRVPAVRVGRQGFGLFQCTDDRFVPGRNAAGFDQARLAQDHAARTETDFDDGLGIAADVVGEDDVGPHAGLHPAGPARRRTARVLRGALRILAASGRQTLHALERVLAQLLALLGQPRFLLLLLALLLFLLLLRFRQQLLLLLLLAREFLLVLLQRLGLRAFTLLLQFRQALLFGQVLLFQQPLFLLVLQRDVRLAFRGGLGLRRRLHHGRGR